MALLTIGLLAALFFIVYLYFDLNNGLLKIFVLDVGQGDAVLIEGPAGEKILIDGGPDSLVIKRLSEVLPFYENSLDLVILSHPHADHLNGLLEVLQRYQVETVLLTGVKYQYGAYDEFYRILKERGVRIYYVDGVHDYKIGKIGLDLIFPLVSIQGENFSNVNNSSIVLRLIYGQNRWLFSGDLEKEKETEILQYENQKRAKINLSAAVLKAGHHGSKTSNSAEWLKAIGPKNVVISCGVNNSFKHPDPATVARFLALGANIWRTDINGTMERQSNGKKIW